MSTIAHNTWCDGEHSDGQERCVSPPVEIGRLSVWLAGAADESPEMVIDTPSTGVVMTLEDAKAMGAALLGLVATAGASAGALAT